MSGAFRLVIDIDNMKQFEDAIQSGADSLVRELLEKYSGELEGHLKDTAPVRTGMLKSSISVGDYTDNGFDIYMIYYAMYVVGKTIPYDFITQAIKQSSLKDKISFYMGMI